MERVAFLVEETNERIEGLLNPESLLVRRRAGVRARRSATGEMAGAERSDDPLIYTGGGRTEYELELLFDTDLTASTVVADDVRELTRPLWDLAETTDEAMAPRPLLVRFVWGKSWNVPGVVVRVSERLERFTESGAPQRSWLKMEFVRVDPAAAEPSAPPVTPPATLEEAAALADADALTHELVAGGGAGATEADEAAEPVGAEELVGEALNDAGLSAALRGAEFDLAALAETVARRPDADDEPEAPPDADGASDVAAESEPDTRDTHGTASPSAEPPSAEPTGTESVSPPDAEADEPLAPGVPEQASVSAAIAASVQAVAAASAAGPMVAVAATLHAAQTLGSAADLARSEEARAGEPGPEELGPDEEPAPAEQEREPQTIGEALDRIGRSLSEAAGRAVEAVRERASGLVAETTRALTAEIEAGSDALESWISGAPGAEDEEANESGGSASEASAEAGSPAPELEGREGAAVVAETADEPGPSRGETPESEVTSAKSERRTEADARRVEAEAERASAEAERAQAEAARAAAESERAKAEAERAAAEARRAQAQEGQIASSGGPTRPDPMREDLAHIRALLERADARPPHAPAETSAVADAIAELGRTMEAARAHRDEEAEALAARLVEAHAKALRDLRAAEEARTAASYQPIAEALSAAAEGLGSERVQEGEASAARTASGALRTAERSIAAVRAPAEAAALEPARRAVQRLLVHPGESVEGAIEALQRAPEALARAEEAAAEEAASAAMARRLPPTDGAGLPPLLGDRLAEASGAVQPGDRLEHIAYQYYRDPALWRLLAHANDLSDPLRVQTGQTLRIPSARSA